MKKLLLFIGIFLFFKLESQIPVQVLDSRNGFVSNNVYDVEIDSKGFLWIITDKGVVRYSGTSSLLFNSNYGMQSDDYYKLIIDSIDNVWLYSNREICKIDYNLKYKHITPTDNYFGRFLIDHDGKIHFSKKISNFKWDHYFIERDSIILIESKFDLLEAINKTGKYKLHGFSFLHGNSLYNYIYDSATKDFFNQEQFMNGKYIHQNKPVLDLGLTTNKNLKLYKLNYGFELLTSLDQYKLFYNSKLIDYGFWPNKSLKITTNNIVVADNKIIIPLDQGVFEFEIEENKLVFKRSILDVNNCTSIIKDNENNLWVSTLGRGLIRLSRYRLKRIQLESTENDPVYMLNSNLSNTIFGATNKNIFDIKKLKPSFQTIGLFEMKVILNDHDKYYYGGNNALYINDKNIFTNVSLKDISISGNLIALCIFNGILIKNKKKLVIPKNKIGDILVDIPIKATSVLLKNDNIYIGTANGILKYKLKETNIDMNKDVEITLLKDKQIKKLKQDQDGSIWVVTEGSGIFLIKDDNILFNFKKNLIDQEIHSLKIDEKDNIWVSTKKGINRISRQNGKYVVDAFTSFHGLPSDYVFDTYCYSDTLYAATNQGLVMVDLCELEKEDFTMPPPVYIQDVGLITPGKSRKISSDSTASLKNDENDLFIRFTGISYRSNGNVKYEYRLLPSIKQWRATENDNVTFDDLHSGNYTFEVRAINAIGTKSTSPAVYRFTVQKHVTETLWFQLLTTAGTILLVWFGFYLWFNYRKRKEQEKYIYQRQISELKLKSLQAQMNPHFIFNSLNAIQQFINVENKKAANDYLARFARLMRFYLNGSENQFITLEEEVNIIKLYCSLEHLRFSDKFTYSIDIEENLPLIKYMVPAMLLQPHIENAIRHGLVPSEKEDNRLSIRLYQTGDGIMCVLADNGIGRIHSMAAKEQNQTQHRSLGSKLSQERILLIRSLKLANIEEKIIDLKNEKGENCGTRVEILVKEMVNYPQTEYAQNELPHH